MISIIFSVIKALIIFISIPIVIIIAVLFPVFALAVSYVVIPVAIIAYLLYLKNKKD